jgi:hypothetical protein
MRILKILALMLMSLAIFSCEKDDGHPKTATTDLFAPERPTGTGNPIIDAGQLGDIIRDDFYGLMRDPALYAVTKEFGYTIISDRQFPIQVAAVAAKTIPWSSWWYPKRETFLFDDTAENGLAPLKKFDLVRRSRFPAAGSASDFERSRYSAQLLSWEGLCDAWAIASIVRPEPKRPVKVTLSDGSKKSVTFTVADLKALLLKTFEAVDGSGLSTYGQKFNGNITGWIYPDMFPEQFHQFIEVQLFQNQRPFIIDHDAGMEVWNIPVYRANYKMDLVPNEPDSVFVTTWIYSAESVLVNEKNFVGTKQAVREYNYVLTGSRTVEGDLMVKSGYWVKGPNGIDSRSNHPDYAIQIADPAKIIQKSWNPELDINLVNEILAKSY